MPRSPDACWGWAPAIRWGQTIADVLADWQARVQQAG